MTEMFFAWLAFACIVGLFIVAIMSRVNGIEETDEDEPLGDMVDVRAIVKKYSED